MVESCGTNGTYAADALAEQLRAHPDGPATSTVKVTANDGDPTDNIGSDEIDVTIANVAPTVTFVAPLTTSATEGQSKTFTFSVSDPGLDAFANLTGFPDCGSGNLLVTGSYMPTSSGGTFQCTFADGPSTSTVRMRVKDTDGEYSNIASQSVTVGNAKPALSSPV